MDNRTVYHFYGITVIVPEQMRTQVRPIDKGLPEPLLDQWKTSPVIRLIANIQFVDRQAYEVGTVIPVSEFFPPIEFRVRYNYMDIMRCGGDFQNLKLAYWSGFEWIPISDSAHDYLVLPLNLGQFAEVKIDSWPADPPLAWVT